MSTESRTIALHAHQRRMGENRQHFVVLTDAEAERLENALRLARTGKMGVERAVPLSTVGYYETTLIVKGYQP